MPSNEASDYYSRGVTHFSQGRYAEAIDAFTRAIESDPALSLAYVDRGYTHFLIKQYERALADFDTAIQLDPTDEKAFGNRGATCASIGRYADAIEDYTRALQLDPNNSRFCSDRGGVYANLDRFSEALVDLNRAIQIDPNLAEAHLNLGSVLAKRGLLREAVSHMDRAAQLGLESAAQRATRARQELYIRSVEDGSMRLAVEAFLDAATPEDLQQTVIKFPYMILPEFIDSLVHSGASEGLPQVARLTVEQRIACLRSLAASVLKEQPPR